MSDDTSASAEQSDATRAKLIAAALEVFLERGYEGTRVQEIARRAGFTTGAIYANFEGKGALLSEAIASQGVAGLDDMVQSLLDDTAAHEVLLRWGMALQSAEPAPVHTLLLEAYAAGARSPEIGEVVRARLARLGEGVAAVIDQARAGGQVDEALDTEALVSLTQNLMLGAMVAKALQLPRPDLDATEHLLRRLIAGFAPQR